MDIIRDRLYEVASPEYAEKVKRYYKNEYTSDDVFLGIRVPKIREIVGGTHDLIGIRENLSLLDDPHHEIRMYSCLWFVHKYKYGSISMRYLVYNVYLDNFSKFNNWDLVDCTAPYITGQHLLKYTEQESQEKLLEWYNRDCMWAKRIALVSNWVLIKNGRYDAIIQLCRKLVEDGETRDLLQKASGWMLRELGKKDLSRLRQFLDKYHKTMPRIMLRYSIEKMDRGERDKYLGKK